MINYVQPGEVLTLTAPSAVTKGLPYLIGSLLVIATASAESGAKFTGAVVGVFTVTKKGDSAWTEGEKIYWDNGEGNFQDSASGNILVGVATKAAAQADTVGEVRLDGVVR